MRETRCRTGAFGSCCGKRRFVWAFRRTGGGNRRFGLVSVPVRCVVKGAMRMCGLGSDGREGSRKVRCYRESGT